MKKYRWKVIVSYKPEHMEDFIFEFDEYSELDYEIEQGPDWRLIDQITITLNPT